MSSFITRYATRNSLKMVDARVGLQVELRAEDIRKGRRKNPTCCAFSLACRREDPTIRAAYFFKTTAWLEYAGKNGARGRLVRYTLPVSVQKEIIVLDRSKKGDAGLYQLSRPARKLGERKPAVKRRSGKRVAVYKGQTVRAISHRTRMVRKPLEMP